MKTFLWEYYVWKTQNHYKKDKIALKERIIEIEELKN